MKIILSWGRMNPPTIGHEKLVAKVKSLANKEMCDGAIYLTHTSDKKKNPLTYEEKIMYAQMAFGSIVHASTSRTIIAVLKDLSKKYDELVLVVGSDRVEEFDTLLNTYNGSEYKFDSIDVVSAGDREGNDIENEYSASVLRELASQNNMNKFSHGLPSAIKSNSEEIFQIIRTRTGK